MKISTKGRYALRLMLDLALHDTGKCVSLRDVSQRQGISVKYLEQIVVLFHRSGFLKSVRGPQGGYMLVRAPAGYTVGEILRVTEGSLAPVACLEDDPNQCARCSRCATLAVWERLYSAINDVVDNITLQNLVDIQRAKDGAGDYVI
nr:Rrf2 family transcriptional regulator [Maliibacterium massiliense]